MASPAPSTLFLGDTADPWVAAMAAALPPDAAVRRCGADLPEPWPEGAAGVRTLVLHRPHLGELDRERLRRLRDGRPAPGRVVLIVGPHARYAQLQQWSGLVDAILPEATAAEVVARHVGPAPPRPDRPRPAVAVVSTNFELRQMLADACRHAGYPAEPRRDLDANAPGASLTIWDVPVLDDGWEAALAAQAAAAPTVALIGFADRETVTRARACGAVACLDLPCDPADLAFVLDRIAVPGRPAVDPPHAVPPAPIARRLVAAPPAASAPGARFAARVVDRKGEGLE